MESEVLSKLKAFVAVTYYRDPGRVIEDACPLVSSGVIDSFGLVDLALFVEEQFNARIEAADLGAGRADTPSEIAELVASRRP